MMLRSSFFRSVSAVCCGTLIALPLQNGYVSSAASDPATTLANSLRALQDGENTAPRDHWDPKYVEAQLGRDPARTFAWVRDHTYWIPYHGILRGPVGVLMDRQGDSLDRALLLATMLKDEGQTVRLAHGTIPAPQAAALLPALDARRLMAAAPLPVRTVDSTSSVASQYGLDPTAVVATLRRNADAATKRQQALGATFKDQAARLAALARTADNGGAKANLDRATGALADHWWVETPLGGAWRAWDLLAAEPGSARVAADRTVDPAAIPADLYHQIAIRVVMESWQNGLTSEKVALEHTIRTSAVIGTSMSLAFVPDDFPQTFPDPGVAAADALRKAAVEQHEWTPILYVGADHIIQNAITDTGNITMPSGQTDVLAVARGATHGLGAAIDDVFGAAPAPPPNAASGSYLSAVWLEYQIDSPGDASQTIRREVFDLRGGAARAAKSIAPPTLDDSAKLSRALALMMTTDILPVSCEFSSQFVTHLAARNLLDNRDALTDVMAGKVKDDYAGAQSLGARLKVSGESLYGLAVTRLNESPLGPFVYVDRPNLLTRHLFFSASGAALVPTGATDIVAHDIGVDPLGPSPFAARMAQGVFDTNAEALASADTAPPTSTTGAFAASRDWMTIASVNDPALARMNLSSDTRQRLATSLASNHLVIVPRTVSAAGGFHGWWQVDKATGETLGIGDRGWGVGPMSEFAVLLYAGALAFLSSWIFCAAGPGSGTPILAHDFAPAVHHGNRLFDLIEVPVAARSTGCLNQALLAGLVGISLSALGSASGIGGAAGRGGGGLPEEPMGTSGNGEGGGPGGSSGGGSGGAGGSGGSSGGGAGGATGSGSGGTPSGGGGTAGQGAGGGAAPGGGDTPAKPLPWYLDPEVEALGRKSVEAHLAGDDALADQYAWERAGRIDDIDRARGYPATLQDQLRANGTGLPFDSTGMPDTVPATPAASPGTGTVPLANPAAPGVSPMANSVPGCPAPCTPGGTANMVGLGGAINALGGGS
jgi:hypothetical protein